MRSKAGKLLYAVRDEKGEFVDIQTYQRAHADDMFSEQVGVGKESQKEGRCRQIGQEKSCQEARQEEIIETQEVANPTQRLRHPVAVPATEI
jgi:hypothetical protein